MTNIVDFKSRTIKTGEVPAGTTAIVSTFPTKEEEYAEVTIRLDELEQGTEAEVLEGIKQVAPDRKAPLGVLRLQWEGNAYSLLAFQDICARLQKIADMIGLSADVVKAKIQMGFGMLFANTMGAAESFANTRPRVGLQYTPFGFGVTTGVFDPSNDGRQMVFLNVFETGYTLQEFQQAFAVPPPKAVQQFAAFTSYMQKCRVELAQKTVPAILEALQQAPDGPNDRKLRAALRPISQLEVSKRDRFSTTDLIPFDVNHAPHLTRGWYEASKMQEEEVDAAAIAKVLQGILDTALVTTFWPEEVDMLEVADILGINNFELDIFMRDYRLSHTHAVATGPLSIQLAGMLSLIGGHEELLEEVKKYNAHHAQPPGIND